MQDTGHRDTTDTGLPSFHDVGRAAGPARRNDRDREVSQLSEQIEIEASARPFAVDAGDEDLSSTPRNGLTRPLQRIETGRLSAAVGVGFPAGGYTFAVKLENDGLPPPMSGEV